MQKNYKRIILAGGSGTRLYPMTIGTSKQLLPIYDKPMIFYPLSVLMNAGIREILIISTPQDINRYEKILDDGSKYGISIHYEIQPNPDGLAQAFIIGEKFIKNDNVSLILGDNIFHGEKFSKNLKDATLKSTGGTIFGYPVNDPERFGVVEFDAENNVISIEEKPKIPKSNFAVTGLYFYDNDVIEIAKSIKPSERGELEITDVNNIYKDRGDLSVELLDKEFTWLDTGTVDSLIEAGKFVQTIEKHQGIKIACLEEIAFKNNWLSASEIKTNSMHMKNSSYGEYVLRFVSENS
jgi:glucose-1-phosphate thymidylyltransferase